MNANLLRRDAARKTMSANKVSSVPTVIAAMTLALFATGHSQAHAQVATEAKAPSKALERFSHDTEGWYFYKERYPEPPKTAEPPSAPPAPAPAPTTPSPVTPPALKPMSVAWMTKYLPIVREAAIDNPSQENVRVYLYMQRVMLDKAENFTNAAILAGTSDPGLNEDVRVPTATALAQAHSMRELRARRDALTSVSNKAGLWVFVDSRCAFCSAAVTMAKRIAKEYKYELRIISVDGKPPKGYANEKVFEDVNRSAFTRFGLKLVPATILALPPDKIGIVAHGAISDQSTIETNLIAAMRSLDALPSDANETLLARSRGLLTAKQIASIEGDATSDAATRLAAIDAKNTADSDAGRAPSPSVLTNKDATPDEVVRHVAALIEKVVRK